MFENFFKNKGYTVQSIPNLKIEYLQRENINPLNYPNFGEWMTYFNLNEGDFQIHINNDTENINILDSIFELRTNKEKSKIKADLKEYIEKNCSDFTLTYNKKAVK